MIEIESGIPCDLNATGRPSGKSKYPFATMRPGQSFFVPVDMSGIPSGDTESLKIALQKVRATVSAAAVRYKNKHPETTWSSSFRGGGIYAEDESRGTTPGVRVWRNE